MTARPGSPEAVKAGCTCPILDNGHGRGYMGGRTDPQSGETLFVYDARCPLHFIQPAKDTP